MWSFMDSTKPTVFTGSNLEGVERVVKEKGKYNLKNTLYEKKINKTKLTHTLF